MIELFRHYWWVTVLIAAGIVLITHALLVKLIAGSESKKADTADKDKA